MISLPRWSRPVAAGVVLLLILITLGITNAGIEFQERIDRLWSAALYHSLGKCGISVVSHERTVIGPSMRLQISGHKNGLYFLVLEITALMFWPLAFSKKMVWAVPIVVGTVLLNLVRLISLFLIGTSRGRSTAETIDFVGMLVLVVSAYGFLMWKFYRPSPSGIQQLPT